ncbi:hypothetical protein AN639_09560 [Candidatus Epulonipiscium fishelsonii]|uniref:Uncharacterized protein n=1 Tax=Candidatus Epulonipiscium fishelsonii TaxID=77094 RepID=A0ACC8XGP8_9FIRM|nr:hypothetical protein AN639_09560 [Epulopiscium sp. SCG-B05WGA-EpuloA1]ONI42584.1 hypothetical protein AN396_14085 [Epulopiscium sp. SCG-B11WGA-EpuloA1]
MQIMNKRQLNILKMLVEKNEYVSTKYIANNFEVSERTVRYDLDSIEYTLRKLGIDLVRVPKNGNKIVYKDELGRRTLLVQIEILQANIFSQDERIVNLALILLLESTTINDLANQLDLSKNTIVQDIKKVKSYLKTFNLWIEAKPYQGTQIQGNEEDIRYAFVDFYRKCNTEKLKIIRTFEENRVTIENLIRSVEISMGVRYSKSSFEELSTIILYCLHRIRKGNYIEYPAEHLDIATRKVMFKVLQDSFKNINLYEEFINQEICYLIKWFKSAKVVNNFKTQTIKCENEIDLIAMRILKDFESYLGISFTQDIEIMNSVITHFNIAVYRLKNNFSITNPLASEIRYEIGIIYKITQEILRKYENQLDVIFPDSEIAYMAMHFGAIFESMSHKIFLTKTVIICNSGFSTSRLLNVRLKSALPNLNILETFGIDEFENTHYFNDIDFIITTIPFTHNKIKVIEVSPLLNNKDLEVIREFTFKKAYQKSSQYLVNRYQHNETFSIMDLIFKPNTQFSLEISDWREAIKEATKPLIKSNKVKKLYVMDIIHSIEKLGTYMVFVPEIAFVHAQAEHVNENSISLITLKNRVQFGDKNYVPVKVIVVLANKTENMNLIKLINILLKGDNVSKLKTAKEYSDLVEII